jgi:neutral ceramidase
MMKRIWLSLAIASGLAGGIVEEGVKDAKPSGLQAGVSKVNIDPPIGIPHQNWGSATHIVAKGIDPAGMFIHALVLSDGRQRFALVDIDAGATAGMADAAKRASAATGIPVEHIRIGASHTHAGPSLSRAKGPVGADLTQYEQMMNSHRAIVADKLVSAVVEANSRLRPAHAYGMVGTGSININRRFRGALDADNPPAAGLNFKEFVDRELPVIRIDNAEGKPYAILVNFQAHGTVLAYENQIVSPDWIGSMRNTVEANLPGATCLYFQGAAGNQGPIEGYSGDLELAHRLGNILGLEAAAVSMRISTVKREPKFEGYTESTALQARQPYRVLGPNDATLKYASKVLTLPRRQYTKEDIDRMVRLTADAERRMAAVRAAGSDWDKSQAAARHRRWASLLERYKQPANPEPVQLEVAVLRIGDMALVLTNGELFAEIGAAVKKASPFAVTLFCGYGSHTGGGYMPTTAEYAFGSYEVDGTPYGQGSAEKVVEESIALLKAVRVSSIVCQAKGASAMEIRQPGV